jgi:hypothetical protein
VVRVELFISAALSRSSLWKTSLIWQTIAMP